MEILDQLRRMAIFASTVDHGSFRAAAKTLRLSPSVVSHHVTQLEEQIGTPLLYRSTRKLSLTADGERLLSAARAMLESVDDGLQAIATHTQQLSGVLRVTLPAVLAQAPIVEQFGQFSTAHPRVRMSLDFSDMRRDVIGDGFDLAIRMGWLKDSSLVARKLYDTQRILVAAPKYLDQRPAPISPQDLKNWDWLELTPVGLKNPTFTMGTQKATVTHPSTRLSVNNAYALCGLARAGAGFALIPEFLAQPDVEAGNLRHVLPQWTPEPLGIYAVWPSNAPRYGLVRQCVEHLAGAARGGN